MIVHIQIQREFSRITYESQQDIHTLSSTAESDLMSPETAPVMRFPKSARTMAVAYSAVAGGE